MKQWLAVITLAIVGAGCAAKPEPTLSPEAFVDRRPVIGPGSNQPIDRPGALTYDAQHPLPEVARDGQSIPPAVQEAVRRSQEVEVPSVPATQNSAPTPQAIAASEPTAEPTGVTTATFQYVGAVVAEVNGHAIFADKVLARLERALASEAKHRDQASFRMLAEEMVHREIAYLIHDEEDFAAAEKSLDKSEKEFAKNLTMDWRRQQISQAGGSEAEARARFAAQGQTFEEAIHDQYRQFVLQIYLHRRIYPLVQISADDIRHFYKEHISDFTVAPAAKFRVIKIKIDPQKADGAQEAMAKAREIRQRAEAGEDFAELAARYNDDPLLQGSKGAVGDKGWMEKGAYVNEKLEQAVWELHPGQITPLVQVNDNIYMAKLEELHDGKAGAFEDPDVQEGIKKKLMGDQLAGLLRKQTQDLEKNAVIVFKDGMDKVTVDMVMQRYPLWAAAK